jgi:hypothetical protein
VTNTTQWGSRPLVTSSGGLVGATEEEEEEVLGLGFGEGDGRFKDLRE